MAARSWYGVDFRSAADVDGVQERDLHMTNRVDASEHESGCYAIATPALPASKETITNKIAAT